MEITSKLIAHILTKAKEPKEIADKLEKYREIKRKIDSNMRSVIEEEKIYKEKLSKLKAEKKNLQNSCDHPLSSYFGDPSGGRDSFHECNICGKEW